MKYIFFSLRSCVACLNRISIKHAPFFYYLLSVFTICMVCGVGGDPFSLSECVLLRVMKGLG